MAQEMKPKMIVRSVVAAMAVLGAGSAAASGFQLLEQNGSGLGNAYAGSAAVADNASTIYFNPAGMTQLKGTHVSSGAAIVKATYKFSDNGSSAGPTFTGTGNGTDGGTTGTIPNFYIATELGGGFHGGIGFGAPFGLKTQYETPWVGAAQSTLFDIKTMNVNPSLAYKISDRFSAGVGLNYQQMEVLYERQASIGLPADSIALQAQDNTWGWNAGVLFKASDSMKLGFSYRSRVKYHLTGDIQARGPNAATLVALGRTGAASANITLPDTFIFSVAQTLGDKWEMLGDVSRTRWSSVQRVDIVQDRTNGVAQSLDAHFRDTWRVALGSNYKLTDSLKLKTGIGYDQGAVKGADYRLVSLPDNDRLWFSLGTQLAWSKSLTLDGGLTYLKVRNAQIYNDQRTASPLTSRGLVNGSYSGHIWIAGVQASYAF